MTETTFDDVSSEWNISDGSVFVPSDDPAENAKALTETYWDYTWTKGEKHVHVPADGYTMGSENHWYTCSVCGQEIREAHSFNGAQNCSVCGVTDGQYFSFTPIENTASVVQNGTPTFTDTVVLPEYYEAESGDKPITEIGEKAFYVNKSLPKIVLPNSITIIDDYAFDSNKGLTEIELPDSLTTIGYCAFSGCDSLTSITIPANVTLIDEGAFMISNSLQSVKILGSGEIGTSAFAGCSDLSSVEISTGITSLGDAAFAQCSSLKTITFPEGSKLTTLVSKAFFHSGLESITIPASVTFIVGHAFGNCSSLTCVIFEDESSEWNISDDSVFLPSSDPAENATALTTTYCDYFWTKVTD